MGDGKLYISKATTYGLKSRLEHDQVITINGGLFRKR